MLGAVLACACGAVVWLRYGAGTRKPVASRRSNLAYTERKAIDTSGFMAVLPGLPRWKETASLEEIREVFRGAGERDIARIDATLATRSVAEQHQIVLRLVKAAIYQYDADPGRCSQALEEARSWLGSHDPLAEQWLYSVIFFQGVSAMRLGENENCILCRGESSCIVPINAAAVHTKPDGSRAAIGYFTEYLQQFPDDIGVRWLLNVAHMTLGEYPSKVDPRYQLDLESFLHSGPGIGKFRDVGHLLGLNRLNQAGGAIMDDFDGDSLLDVAVTTMDPAGAMAFYHNRGDGTFEDRSEAAGVTGQLGGLVCYQTDFNNDGRLDVFIPRGAWLPYPVRPSLLCNLGGGRFRDVTAEAGLAGAVNSIAAAWADYDNDGWLDLFVACEKQPNRLYHNRGDGTFVEVALAASVAGENQEYKGCTWIDYDNDRYPDLFVTSLSGVARLFHNNRDGSFTDVTGDMGIDGPRGGFACWSWDYDNDGWLDIFATSYDRTLSDVVRGLIGRKHSRVSSRLFRNKAGKGFENRIAEAGLDMVFATMGCNFGDFDNDGWLDFYLGTGDPDLSTLVPNRMFRNRSGGRFEEITGSSGTGHLQKGHGVACGDWDRDGDVDIFIEMGGALNGDKYHNIMFQNPGQGNNWITMKLVGKKTNRAAIGARIKVVTAGDAPLSIYRHITSGSSFGANPLRQTIGVGKADRIAEVRVDWPTSGTAQVFRDLAVNQAIEITELETDFKSLPYPVIPVPE
jgi:FG-GAP-like repeat/ASPIC and UnbV